MGAFITAPATPDAQRWQGWGSALKPSVEPAVLCRKPLIGTVAANVLAHSTGALHIDACRHAPGAREWLGPQRSMEEIARICRPNTAGQRHDGGVMNRPASPLVNTDVSGRWPANLIHVPKPSKRERQRGTDGLPAKQREDVTGRTPGSAGQNSARAGVTARGSLRNAHPTVKPVRLMRWLVRLVTPPGGLVVDPFVGSGTTAIAAVLEGFDVLGFEREAEYHAVAEARTAHALARPDEWADTEPGRDAHRRQ